MKRLIFAVGVIGAALCPHATPAAAEVPCFDTLEAVMAAHPHAAHVHYTDRYRATRCWFVDDAEEADAVTTQGTPTPKPPVRSATRTRPRHPATIAPEPHTTAAAPPPNTKTAGPSPDTKTAGPPPDTRTAGPPPEDTKTAGPPPDTKTAGAVPEPPALAAPALAVNPEVLNRLLPASGNGADFESRFSASGMRK